MVAHHLEEPQGFFNPYQIQLEDGTLIFAPEDSYEYIQGANAASADAGASVHSPGASADAAAPSSSASYDPAIHYPLLVTLKKKKVSVAPPSWAKVGHRGGSGCPCCKGNKMNPAFF